MTPSGEIFHVLTGFVGPEDLQGELEWALATYGKITERSEDRKTRVRDAHVEFLRQAGFSDGEIEQPTSGFPELFAGAAPRLPIGADGALSLGRAVDGIARSHVLADHRFVIEHPLLPMSRFKPETLVGNGKSFFGSTSFGDVPGDFGRPAQKRGGR
ncbi:MAG TPA: hypothetical protein VMV10_29705 [Pirellulales bacterium]|nr:hypothetical protein [Pirellulales bacterium]